MAQHNFVGQMGEKMAMEYLVKNGYEIVEQNYRTKFAEIDLVAFKPEGILGMGKGKMVFVEVRTKIGERYGSPEDTINRAKLWKVLQNSKSYMGFKNWQGAARIDAICIVLKNDFSIERLTHHENIVS